ncbi:hypothetical protein CCR75_008106 [Bremia lactucae]|uniref:Uncharacterized protein n=1 Tax=Bremia lactucae TaxID=4779 RepID=A0A976FMW5_BRELC|nr:hypothetical protein CCR75_008106 [Bremia lactucae]
MDKNRSQFIQQLVSALQARDDISLPSSASANCVDGELISDNNQETDKLLREDERQFLSVSISATERIQLAQEAYMQLQFDYPQTQASSIEALAELYRRISTEKLTAIAAQIPITTSLLDGVAYLNNQISSSSSSEAPTSRCSESSGLLAASILILLFRLCLEMPGDTRVDKLLSSLVVKQPLQSNDHDVRGHEFKLLQETNDPLVEIYASEEDPDDLSDVYEGQLLESPYHSVAYLHHPVSSQFSFSHTEKLQLIASCTFSSSFHSISIEKWEQWHLNDALFAILRRLLATSPPKDTNSERTGPLIPFYGVQGEWKRYLYVLRDRVLRFSQCSQRTIWQFKDLIDFYQKRESAAFAIDEPMCSTQWMPQHFVFSVLAELAVSQEFNCKGTQQMQQNWSLVFQALVPNIMQEIHRILSRSSANVKAAIVKTIHDDEEDEIRVVYLHLLHFMIVASSNVHKTIELLFASGMLQILLKLLPSFDIDMTQQCNTKRWFRALLRFVGESLLSI